MDIKAGLNKAANLLYGHVVDSTAIWGSTTWIYAATECIGMPLESSIRSQAAAGVATYAGLGFVLGKGRDLSMRLCGVDESSSTKKRKIHDIGFLLGVTAAVTPALGALGGVPLNDIVYGTVNALAIALPVGPVYGFATDVARDLMGTKPYAPMPNAIRELPTRKKKALAVAGFAACMGLAGAMYAIVPPIKAKFKAATTLESKIENK